jgi:hypothetical protein
MLITTNLLAQNKSSLPVSLNDEGKLIYTPDNKGNRVPDFSFCGYASGNSEIPNVQVVVTVPNVKGDATQTLQKAINYVAKLPLNQEGFRGAILLDKGKYLLNGRLRIEHSGIVIRGSGAGDNGTTIIASGKDRYTLLRIVGPGDIKTGDEVSIQDVYIPVNGRKITIGDKSDFKVGDHIFIRRPTTKKWVDDINMHEYGGETSWIGWHPERNNIIWDRKVVGIEGNTLELDAPITTALDSTYGGGFIAKYNWENRISKIGIENLNLVSEFDKNNLKDEEHCWMAITIENAKNCWVRQVNFRHFAGSAVAVYETAKQVTVEDCISTEPVSEIGGQRRYTFYTNGQQVLFQRCYAEHGYHDFAVGNFAPGPNAFVQCESHLPYSFSGTIDRWASGVLFDLVYVDGNAISYKNRLQNAHGAGWSAANSMIWQSSASRIDCFSPPTAINWAYGTWGQFAGNGFWHEPNSFVNPRSLYYAQLEQRIGKDIQSRSQFLPIEFGSTSSPSVELAQQLTAQSAQPHTTLKEWISTAYLRNPIPTESKKAFNILKLKSKKTAIQKLDNRISLENGWLIDKNGIIHGNTIDIKWWRGSVRPYYVEIAEPHITRYVPGRYGKGLTDDLEEITETMYNEHILAIDHNYGLWYDRRRDDHELIRRQDGEVWPPFYELPFARSGQELAFDGLSKYDLTKPNYWYWNRLKQFADLADTKGLVLIHQNYFQHNILEAAAHYTDFPWRTANNINNTGLPEPPPYAGNKRVFLAEQFYDINNEHRRELHRQYIYQCLNNFSENSNVIQMISFEYTGPLHFVEFWLDVIAEWEEETGKNAIVGLSTTKDVQDAILADPKRSKLVEVIDIRYWHYKNDGSAYAPKGGLNLSPRQHTRLINRGKTTFQTVYKAVFEYKSKFPNKAVTYFNYFGQNNAWATFIAGGSMANIPKIEEKGFAQSASQMQPVENDTEEFFMLKHPEGEQIIYILGGKQLDIDMKNFKGSFVPVWINPIDGKTLKYDETIEGGNNYSFFPPDNSDIVIWIKKK